VPEAGAVLQLTRRVAQPQVERLATRFLECLDELGVSHLVDL
jgi:hypothetical protein